MTADPGTRRAMDAFRKISTSLPGVVILEPRVFGDERGFFLESYNEKVFAELGIEVRFVQDNHSSSRQNVLRGLHYQIKQAQGKLVRAVEGWSSSGPHLNPGSGGWHRLSRDSIKTGGAPILALFAKWDTARAGRPVLDGRRLGSRGCRPASGPVRRVRSPNVPRRISTTPH